MTLPERIRRLDHVSRVCIGIWVASLGLQFAVVFLAQLPWWITFWWTWPSLAGWQIAFSKRKRLSRRLAILSDLAPVPLIGGVTGPVVGWRAWIPEGLSFSLPNQPVYGGMLRSVYVSRLWLQGDQHAECMVVNSEHVFARVPWHAAPAENCSCGIYGMNSPLSKSLPPIAVRGVILGWGRIQEHAAGFRAEHARLLALEDPGHLPVQGGTLVIVFGDEEARQIELGFDAQWIAQTAAKFYGVPCLPRPQIEALIKEWS